MSAPSRQRVSIAGAALPADRLVGWDCGPEERSERGGEA
jgi:hypothetical protein